MNYEIKGAAIKETMYPRFGRVIMPMSGTEGDLCVQFREGGLWLSFSHSSDSSRVRQTDVVPFPPGTQITFTQE